MFLKFIFLCIPILISVAFLTLLERKIISLVGLRLGPNKVSFSGVLQPIFDAVKLANKQTNSLLNSSFWFYYASCSLFLLGSIFVWMSHGSDPSSLNFKFPLLFIMIILGLNSLNSILCGWSTFSKYSLMGSIRTLAQLVSYESVIYLILLFFVYFFYSFNFFSFNFYSCSFLIFIPFCFYIWVPSLLAEMNRTPYDFSEGESELVSGFNTEFGSSGFTLIFLSEYTMITFLSFLSASIFFSSFFSFYFVFMLIFIVWVRTVIPRFRFDKLMMLCWKFFVPFMTVYFLYFCSFLM